MSNFEFQTIVGTGTHLDGTRAFLCADLAKDGRVIVSVSGGLGRYDIETKHVTGFADCVAPVGIGPEPAFRVKPWVTAHVHDDEAESEPAAEPEPITASAHPGLTLTVDAETSVVSGSVKGNEAHAALLPRPWVWSRTAGG